MIGATLEKAAVWIDTLAEATVKVLRTVQPGCTLPAGMLKAAHLAHVNARGTAAADNLKALQALELLLQAKPSALPEGLVTAVLSLDTSVEAALEGFGQAEAAAGLKLVRPLYSLCLLSPFHPLLPILPFTPNHLVFRYFIYHEHRQTIYHNYEHTCTGS